MAVRRELRFESLDDIVREAEHLLAVGYEPAGKWDLAQCCGHLSEWFRYQLDGFPRPPLLLRPVFWAVRNTVGPRMGRKLLTEGTMKAGLPTIPQSVPPAGANDAAAVGHLRAVIARWDAHDGPFHPSPLFGPMSKEAFRRVHLLHAAHHLSYLIPRS